MDAGIIGTHRQQAQHGQQDAHQAEDFHQAEILPQVVMFRSDDVRQVACLDPESGEIVKSRILPDHLSHFRDEPFFEFRVELGRLDDEIRPGKWLSAGVIRIYGHHGRSGPTGQLVDHRRPEILDDSPDDGIHPISRDGISVLPRIEIILRIGISLLDSRFVRRAPGQERGPHDLAEPLFQPEAQQSKPGTVTLEIVMV